MFLLVILESENIHKIQYFALYLYFHFEFLINENVVMLSRLKEIYWVPFLMDICEAIG